MKILYMSKTDDMFNDMTLLCTILNPCNTKSVAGAGLSYIIKKKYPSAYKEYVSACEDGSLKVGSPIFSLVHQDENPFYVCHFPTKDHWKDPSNYEYIESGMESLVNQLENIYNDSNTANILIPALGAGLGLLDYSIVRDIIEYHLKKLDHTGYLFKLYPPKENT